MRYSETDPGKIIIRILDQRLDVPHPTVAGSVTSFLAVIGHDIRLCQKRTSLVTGESLERMQI